MLLVRQIRNDSKFLLLQQRYAFKEEIFGDATRTNSSGLLLPLGGGILVPGLFSAKSMVSPASRTNGILPPAACA